ncbi:parallel beta helix pectate lyase-like protein [Acinetobacter calcoaceticus]|uniref:Parallel beta helix pectate lyase-like protein n=1 Tax=Acinetobacter calcoaceticus TaxID=471 RepID=A0A4R1XYN6_ACICA|nr:parallel beta helix pectate lyase-like protein [Acinetobacter calcoaceticus]
MDQSAYTQHLNAIVHLPSIQDLKKIKSKDHGQSEVIVAGRYHYRFVLNDSSSVDDVSVVEDLEKKGHWILQKPNAIYASDFAVSNIKRSQSKYLQVAYDAATRLGTVFIVDDEFWVGPTELESGIYIYLRSHSEMAFSQNGKLRVLPTATQGYHVLYAYDIEDYRLLNANLEGDRFTHLGTKGEWGYGLTIYQSKGGYIYKPRVINMWGDGIYIGNKWGTASGIPQNITIIEPYISQARRNGISFTAGENILIQRPYIEKTNGTAPQAGIDIEPEEATSTLSVIKQSVIEDATLVDNVEAITLYLNKDKRHVDLKFLGKTQVKNTTSNKDKLSIYKFVDQIDQKQTGKIYFEHLQWESKNPSAEISSVFFDTGLDIVFNKLEYTGATEDLTLFYTGHVIPNYPYGGLSFHNLTGKSLKQWGQSTYFVQSGADKLVSNLQLDSDKKINTVFNHEYAAVTLGVTSFIKPRVEYLQHNTSTLYLPQNIDLVGDGQTKDAVQFDTKNDFRKLKFTARIQQGIQGRELYIKGLNVIIDGKSKHKARSQSAGAWIELENVKDGATLIYDSFGKWQFED